MASTATGDGGGLRVLYADDRRYAPVRVLGEGHTARVLLATDPAGDQVAIKAMKDDISLSPREFMSEADRLQALRRQERELFPDRPDSQSAFPTVLDRDPDERFFVMEVAPGRPLSRIFSNRQIVRPEQAVGITIRVGEALMVATSLGLRAQDLKSDAIFWDHVSGRVVILDWNVVADSRMPETGWLPADLRTTASYLDALLAGGETVSEWSGRIYDPPARWGRYYRALRLSLEDLVRHPEGAHLEEFLSTLLAVEAMLGDRPENLLEFVKACLLDARDADDDERIGLADQAAAAAEIALATRDPALMMDGRALLAQAEELAGADGQLIARLWAAVRQADESGGFDIGKSLETYRLRALAAVARRAPGYAGEAHRIAVAMAMLKWDEAARQIGALRALLTDHPSVSSLLSDLEHEAKGLRDGRAGLVSLDAGDKEKARAQIAEGLASLSKVRYHDALVERFPMLREQFAALPAPAARKTEVDQTELAVQAARRRFARQGRVSLEGFEQYADAPGVRELEALQRAWDEADPPGADSPPHPAEVIPVVVDAMQLAAAQRGCFPLSRIEKLFDRIAENMDLRLRTVDREVADKVRTDADALGDACRSVTDALRDTDLDRGWTTEAVDALKTWRRRFRERSERASEAHQTLSLYVRGLDKLGADAGLAGRAELLTRLQRRRPEDDTVKRLMAELRIELDEAEQRRPGDADVQAARRVLDPMAPTAAAMPTGAAISDARTLPNRFPAGGERVGLERPVRDRPAERSDRRAAPPADRRTPPRRTPPPPARRQDSKTTWIALSAVVVLLVIGAFIVLRPPPDPGPEAPPVDGKSAAQLEAERAAALAAQKAEADRIAAEKAAADAKAAADQAAAQPPIDEKAADEKAAADQAAADAKAAEERAAAEKAAAEKAAAEKAAAEKAAAERAAAQKAARPKPPRARAPRETEEERARRLMRERATKLREQMEKERAARAKAAEAESRRRAPDEKSDGKSAPPKPTAPTPKPPKPKQDGDSKPAYLTDDW